MTFALILLYGMVIEPNHVVVRTVEIPSEPLARFFDDAVVVHVSDFQMRRFGWRERRLLELLKKIDPDYVFITGDFSQKNSPYGPVLDLLEAVPAREGIWGVLGNTDYNGQRGYCSLCHEKDAAGTLRRNGPIRMLRNETILLERNGKKLSLTGVDEYDGRDWNSGAPGPAGILRSLPRDIPALVLGHTPFCAELAERDGALLYLAGDTHGGQVALPDPILQKVLPDKHMQYRTGLYSIGSLWLHVNPGIGWNDIPIRIGCPPEITVLRFPGESP